MARNQIAVSFTLCADMSQQQAAGFLAVSGKDCIYDGAPFREGGQKAVTDAQPQTGVGTPPPVQLRDAAADLSAINVILGV